MFAPRALENTQSSLLTEPEEGATALLEQLPHFYHHFFPDLFSLDLDFFSCWICTNVLGGTAKTKATTRDRT